MLVCDEENQDARIRNHDPFLALQFLEWGRRGIIHSPERKHIAEAEYLEVNQVNISCNRVTQ